MQTKKVLLGLNILFLLFFSGELYTDLYIEGNDFSRRSFMPLVFVILLLLIVIRDIKTIYKSKK
jgi:hypothetical protein